jgi:hypothetical protein
VVTRGSKEFQDMGVKGSTVVEPWVRSAGLKERWEGEAIGCDDLVGENAVIEGEGYVGVDRVVSVIGERGNESVEEEDCWVWDLVEDGECVGYGKGGG